MIKIEKTHVNGFIPAIHGMRNPMNSWDKSDSYLFTDGEFGVGPDDYNLMLRLAKNGPVHAKYRRMIVVYIDVTAPLYWWKEMDTYKIGTVCNSCSTMHKIAAKEFILDDFSHEHMLPNTLFRLRTVVECLNAARNDYIATKNKGYWWQMIQLLPSSYNQRRTLMLNYEALANIYASRKDHKLDEWRDFCRWIESLPYYEIITLGEEDEAN